MKLNNITKFLSKATGRTGLKIKKYSPEILVVAGITGIIGSTILACRATLKAEETIDNHRSKIETINLAKELEGDYTAEDRKKDLVVTYVQTSVDFIKLYGPAVTLCIASICCIVGAHGIMRKRNVALMAAYKAVEEGFTAYRKRVVSEYGEDKDYIFKNGLQQSLETETEVDENGKAHKVKKEKLVTDPNGLSVYARFFDEACTQWSKEPEYNLLFLRSQQNYFNDMLKARGHVFLNEVYDALGIPRSKAGQVVGWVLSEGDGFIDFGVYDQDDLKGRTAEAKRNFVNGYERNILLDFNVDGIIYDMI